MGGEIKRAWEQYISGGSRPTGVRPLISASWERCRNRGIDPWQEARRVQLQGRDLEEHRKNSRPVARIGKPFMEKISQFTSPGLLVFLTDAEGYIVAAVGAGSQLGQQAESFREGSLLREEDHGTNAVGLVLRDKSPCQVEGAEHYLFHYHTLACAAAPIFSPEGEFLAILGAVGARRYSHPHTLGMVVAAATAVENQLGLERATDQLYSVVHSISEGLIAVDNKGIITQMNAVAGKIFGLNPQEAVEKPVEEVFRNSFPLLRLIKTSREGFNDRELAVDINGRRVHITITSRPIRSQQGEVFGVVLTCREMKSVQRLVTRMVGAQARFDFSHLVGEDSGFQEAVTMARRVARTDSTVLLMGESGTGKEMFAQAIHNASPRRDGPFVAMNCAALPRDLVESELFGYEEGAFTGAKRGGRPGKFELANGGTLFLDEIGDIPLETQVSLLRVLQEKQVIRIGGHTPIPVQIRIIAATNRDIGKMVQDGHFRLDLYYRLSVINIHIPPLRERGEDVLHLAKYFLNGFARQLKRDEIELTSPVREILLQYQWPGNVRELQNVMEQAMHLVEGQQLKPEHLPERFLQVEGQERLSGQVLGESQNLAGVEKKVILKTLELCHGNISQAAKCLGLGRTTLYRKLRRYGISLEDVRQGDSQ